MLPHFVEVVAKATDVKFRKTELEYSRVLKDDESKKHEQKKAMLSMDELDEINKLEKDFVDYYEPHFLVIDTETTGLSPKFHHVVQLAWSLYSKKGLCIDMASHIIRPDNFKIPLKTTAIHGISTFRAMQVGKPAYNVYQKFNSILKMSKVVIGHNIIFDIRMLLADLNRYNQLETMDLLASLPTTCTKEMGKQYLCMPKFPKLVNLYKSLFYEDMESAHNALYDVIGCAKCFFYMMDNPHG
jgi:DNA polymerase III alpha subunit (gram-positive type)